MGFYTTSVWLKVGLVCLLLATVLFVIGFSTKSWMSSSWASRYRVYYTDYSNYGLWRYDHCGQGRCYTYNINNAILSHHGWKGWYRATQVLECIGLICLVVDLIFILLLVFGETIRQRTAVVAVIILSFCAASAMGTGFLLYGLNMPPTYDVDWSMGLAIAACCLTFIAGVLAVVDLNK